MVSESQVPLYPQSYQTADYAACSAAAAVPGIAVELDFSAQVPCCKLSFAIGVRNKQCILNCANKIFTILPITALSTGLLLAISIPPLLPGGRWCRDRVAVIIAKQLYGGLGHNPLTRR
ncbi:MAG: RnfABCDGE type electron transport complex subunit D [Enterobacteriaceae bacterium]